MATMFSRSFDALVQVLILKHKTRTLKALQAIVRGIWMVDESWLNKSVEKSKLLSAERFDLDWFPGAKKARVIHQHKDPRLFEQVSASAVIVNSHKRAEAHLLAQKDPHGACRPRMARGGVRRDRGEDGGRVRLPRPLGGVAALLHGTLRAAAAREQVKGPVQCFLWSSSTHGGDLSPNITAPSFLVRYMIQNHAVAPKPTANQRCNGRTWGAWNPGPWWCSPPMKPLKRGQGT